MKTTIKNDCRVYLISYSNMKKVLCNIEDLNEIIKKLELSKGQFKIFYTWENKLKFIRSKELDTFFEGAQLTREFNY